MTDKKSSLAWFGCLALMLIVALTLSTKLLSWAWEQRQARSQQIETTEVTAALRERQLSCLARNIYFEAAGEPFEGKVAVAQVTLNRAKVDGFPDDVCAVVYQKNRFYDRVLCQFSWVCQDNGYKIKPTNPDEFQESMIVARKVLLEGFRLPGLESALYFHADYVNPEWRRQRVAKIGRHIFYK